MALEEVLRRCHTEELLPLAKSLGIGRPPKAHDALSRQIVRTLRQSGVGELQNLLQYGSKGPPYQLVVDGLAQRLGLRPQEEVADTEQLLLGWWQRNGDLPAPIALRLSRQMELEGLPDQLRAQLPTLDTPKKLAVAALPRLFFFHLFFPILVPVAGLRLLLWLFRPRDEALLPAILGVAELRRRVEQRFTIGLVGPPSAGKDAAIKALFGLDTGNVSPIAGSTTTVCTYPLPAIEGLEVVNTPGLGDVEQALTDQTRGILDHVDIFLFLVNAQGGVRQRERDEWARCLGRRKPALIVVNKVDTLRERDRERFLADVAAKLEVPAARVVGVAFDPLPKLAPAPIGVEAVREWLADQLRLRGKNPQALWP